VPITASTDRRNASEATDVSKRVT